MNKFKAFGLSIILGSLVFAMIISNIRVAIKNNDLNEKLTLAKQELEVQKNRARKLELLSTYYASDTFQELEARRRLFLKSPGETVFQIRGVDTTGNNFFDVNDPGLTVQATTEESNLKRWLDYLSGRE